MDNLKKYLDELVEKYEQKEFIKSDPIQFPHRFNTQTDIEISGLISSSLAYGKRSNFIEKLEFIHKILGQNPTDFVLNFNSEKDFKRFENFQYRYNSGYDVCLLINSLQKALSEYKTIENIFLKGYKNSNMNIKNGLLALVETLYGYNKNFENVRGFKFLIPSPKAKSACKRLNMFLRWMVRKPPVDFGLWKSVNPSKLIIPLDIHVSKVSRALSLTERKSDDWQTAELITEKLKEFDKNDPAKYDFALFDIGIDKLLQNKSR